MTQLDRHIAHAQRRLWINRWLVHLGWCLLIAAGLWTVALVVQRAMGAGWPMIRLAPWTVAGALAASLIGLLMSRESRESAAMTVDAAAGLRERVTSSLYASEHSDPFAQAVVADAHRAVAGISPARLIPIRWSRSLTWAGAAVLAAAGFFWLFPQYDVLGKAQAENIARQREQEREKARVEIAKSLEGVKQVALKNPDLKAAADIAKLEDVLKQDKNQLAPDATRREAIKGIEKLSDQLKEKAESDRYSGVPEMKRMMSQLGEQSDPKSQVGKLAQAMAQGDYQGAQDAIKKMQEELAKREHNAGDNPLDMKKAQQQLAELAQKLEQMQDKKTLDKLQQMGVSQKDLKRLMEALSKKDPKQLQELAKQIQQQLQKQGMTKEQAQKLMQQLRKNQQACQQCNKMGQQMSQAAKAMQQGKGQDAQQALQKAGEQLSQLEQLSQELEEMQTQLSELDDLKNNLGEKQEKEETCDQCKGAGQCNGKPCSKCNGKGKCNKDFARGRGRGAGPALRDRDQSGNAQFVKRKANTRQNKGDVIGQYFVKGKTEKGESRATFEEAAAAAEREATDAIEKERLPPIYHRAMKSYFDRLGEFDRPEQETSPGDKKQ